MAGGTFGAGVEAFKNGFFDRLRVLTAAERATDRVLGRFGSFVRTRARTSMRRRKGPSAPGSPPSVHTGDKFATLKNILFARDPARRSVVVGPVALNQVDRLNGQLRRGTVPELHEYGGTLGVTEVLRPRARVPRDRGGWRTLPERWVRADQRQTRRLAGLPKRVRHSNYPARPFMRPAFAAELGGKLRDQLRGMMAA